MEGQYFPQNMKPLHLFEQLASKIIKFKLLNELNIVKYKQLKLFNLNIFCYV